MKVAIIGAGAVGCFCAALLSHSPYSYEIDIYDAAEKPLRKVAVTGGGRCNLTHDFAQVSSLKEVYPRGSRLMERLFRAYDYQQTMAWFTAHDVPLMVQPDGCVFPVSQQASDVVQALLQQTKGCRYRLKERVSDIQPVEHGYQVITTHHDERYDWVVIATGGASGKHSLDFLRSLSPEVVTPVPSLYALTLAESEPPLTALMGLVVPQVTVSVAATKLHATGDLLLTHWGVSGPAILRLTSYAAHHLAEHEFRGTLCIDWLGGAYDEEAVRQRLTALLQESPRKQIGSIHFSPSLAQRLWAHLLNRVGIAEERRCSELGKKQVNRLTALLIADTYEITGRSLYREEFVTAGGIALTAINPATLSLKAHPAVYVGGEVLDVDGITGGYNLQAAWTMGYHIAQQIIAQNAKQTLR